MNTEQAVQSSSSNTNVVNITDSIGIGGSIIIIGIELIIITVITVILCFGKKKVLVSMNDFGTINVPSDHGCYDYYFGH